MTGRSLREKIFYRYFGIFLRKGPACDALEWRALKQKMRRRRRYISLVSLLDLGRRARGMPYGAWRSRSRACSQEAIVLLTLI